MDALVVAEQRAIDIEHQRIVRASRHAPPS
jgi:hypothetical protein